MAITEKAQANHQALFPNDASTLQKTDPELIEIFDNWAFDELLEHTSLDTRTRLMVQLAALIACQAISEFRVLAGGALNIGVTAIELRELVYQAVPYVGMGRTFDFLHAINELFRSRGIELPLAGQATTSRETRFEKGLAAQKRIFGELIDAMRTATPKDQLAMQDLLASNCFGDFYTRTGLDLKLRELLTFSMLASLGGCEPQLAGHVAGNLAMGNDRQALLDTLTQLLPFIGYPRTLNAIRVVDQAAPR